MLVLAQKVVGIIGRKWEFIKNKKLAEETRARIMILDNLPGKTERAIMVSANEELDFFSSACYGWAFKGP